MNLSLPSKIVLICSSVLLLGIGGNALVNGTVFVKEYSASLQSEAFAIGRTLNSKIDILLKLGIPIEALVDFDQQCKQLVESYENVSYAMVVDLDGKILFHSDPSQHGRMLSDPALLEKIRSDKDVFQVDSIGGNKHYDFFVPVFGLHDEHIAAVRIGFPLEVISKKAGIMAVYSTGFGLVFLSLGTVLMIIALNKWVKKPVQELITVMGNIMEQGTIYAELVEITSKDELGEMAQLFNKMILEIRRVQEKLKNYTLKLEMKVQDRTIRLVDANQQLKLELFERMQAEEGLRQSEKRFRDLVENSLVGICIVKDNMVVYKNPEQERIWGPLVPLSLNTDEFLRFIHHDDLRTFKQFYKKALSKRVGTLDTEIRFLPFAHKGRDDVIRYMYCRASPIEYGSETSVLFNMLDITKLKELEHLVIVREKMVSLGHVAAGLAHEIRGPLSGINIYLDTIGDSFEDNEGFSDIQEIIKQAKAAAGKIASVIRRALDFSRPHTLTLQLADINNPVREAIQLSNVALLRRGIEIQSDLNKELPKVYIDPQLIEQVIMNLITNASEAMRDGEGKNKIFISSSVDTSDVIIQVSDTGEGISPEIKDRIFEPFYSTKNRGLGIGLSLCQRIIADHRGKIEVDTSKLGGAKFTIKIPIDKRVTYG